MEASNRELEHFVIESEKGMKRNGNESWKQLFILN